MVPSRASCFFSLFPELYLSFTPSSRPVYASVDPEGLPDIYHTFLERPLQPILSRDHREEYSKSSLTVALRYGEPVSESSNALSQSSGDTARVATESTRTHEAESPRRLVFTPLSVSSLSHQWLQSQAVTASGQSVLDAKVCLGLTASSSARGL